MNLTSLMNHDDRLLSPPVTPKSYPLDTLSKQQEHDELVVPTTDLYMMPPVSPPILSLDTLSSIASSSPSPMLSSHLTFQQKQPSHKRKIFQFHLERQKALPLNHNKSSLSSIEEYKQEQVQEICIQYPLPLPLYRLKKREQKKSTIYLKRKQPKPLRSLSLNDDTTHAFSFYFNAEQVRQYGNKEIHRLKRRTEEDIFMADNNNNNDQQQFSDDNKQQGDQLSHMTSKRPIASTLASMVDRHMKKARTEAAAAYDRVDVTVNDAFVYDPEWVPLYDVFDRKPNVRPTYKGKANSPLQIDHMEFYDQLHPSEVIIASQLRLQPKQYLMCKRSLILGAQDSYKKGLPFRKSDAQKLCRIDVNKVSHLWALFARLGWLEPHAP